MSRPGAGRGKGSKSGRWPGTQLELLATIVAKREEVQGTKAPIVALANIPTFLWLGWGEGYVRIRQVRRAVGTWAEFYQHLRGGCGRASTETARLAKMIKGPGARRADISAFANELAKLAISKQLEVTRKLLTLGDKVIDPEDLGREFGAPGASVDAKTLLTGVVVLQYASEHAVDDRLADLRSSTEYWFTDWYYRQARQRWFESHYFYQHMQPLLRVVGPAELYRPRTLEDAGNDACRDVVMLMGLGDPRMPTLPLTD